jgi:GcrA cell cycle regulator
MGIKADWATETNIQRLREEWTGSLSSAAIGRLFGVSKNAIVGKVHRLGLPARPSPTSLGVKYGPIQRAALQPTMKIRKAAATLVPLASIVPVVRNIAPPPRTAKAKPWPPSGVLTVRAEPPKPVIAEPAPVSPRPIIQLSGRECCWPIGDPKTKEFRYCDGPAPLGRSYCDKHHKLAYVKVQRRL